MQTQLMHAFRRGAHTFICGTDVDDEGVIASSDKLRDFDLEDLVLVTSSCSMMSPSSKQTSKHLDII